MTKLATSQPEGKRRPADTERLKRQVEHLHRLGPRPLCEFLIEFAGNDLQVDLDLQLSRYALLDPDLIDALDGRDLYLPLAVVEGGRR